MMEDKRKQEERQEEERAEQMRREEEERQRHMEEEKKREIAIKRLRDLTTRSERLNCSTKIIFSLGSFPKVKFKPKKKQSDFDSAKFDHVTIELGESGFCSHFILLLSCVEFFALKLQYQSCKSTQLNTHIYVSIGGHNITFI